MKELTVLLVSCALFAPAYARPDTTGRGQYSLDAGVAARWALPIFNPLEQVARLAASLDARQLLARYQQLLRRTKTGGRVRNAAAPT